MQLIRAVSMKRGTITHPRHTADGPTKLVCSSVTPDVTIVVTQDVTVRVTYTPDVNSIGAQGASKRRIKKSEELHNARRLCHKVET